MTEQEDYPLDPHLQEKLEHLRPTPPRDPQAVARGRERFLTELDSMPEFKAQSRFAWLTRWLKSDQVSKEKNMMGNNTKRLAFSAILAAVLILVFLFGGAGATALAAQSALPGDALYPVKTGLEQTRVALASDAYDEAQLYLQYAQRRLDEINALVQEGRFDDITTATQEFEDYTNKAIAALQVVMAGDPERAAMLSQQVSDALVGYTQALKGVWVNVPEPVRPAIERAISASQRSEGTPLSEDNANDNADDNANDNGNDNANDNANDNDDGNANDNGNDNANDNGDDNGNDNANDNANDNGNDNANDNGNENSNDNANDNGDDNGNDNANDNGDDNGNDNANDNGDDNANDNSNDNGNDNANDNGDENSNDNDSGDDSGNDNSLLLTPPVFAI